MNTAELVALERAVAHALNSVAADRANGVLPRGDTPATVIAQVANHLAETAGVARPKAASEPAQPLQGPSEGMDSLERLGPDADGMISLDDSWSPSAWVEGAVQASGLVLDALALPTGVCGGIAARDHITSFRSPEEFKELLIKRDVLGTLSVRLHAAASELRSEVAAQEQCIAALQCNALSRSKSQEMVERFFAQSKAAGSKFGGSPATLTYGPLSLFFSGLEGLVGTPHPQLEQGMKSEHCMAADSWVKFTTSNYLTATKPVIEWHFVADPTDAEFLKSIGGEWPEDKMPPMEGGRAFKRSPMPPKDFAAPMAEINRTLTNANEPPMLQVEFVACRLYTGPMFVKYNTVLRGVGASKVRARPSRASTTPQHEPLAGRRLRTPRSPLCLRAAAWPTPSPLA